jgi:putative DeoR family transcriptional regulator (stage III sporulation protein D)
LKTYKAHRYIIDRAIEIGNYVVKKKATVRQAAKKFCVCKSTVHKDVTDILLQVDTRLYNQVKKVLQRNMAERHIRGGQSTREKHRKARKERVAS